MSEQMAEVHSEAQSIEANGIARFNHREAFCLITYKCAKDDTSITVWNSRDGRIPDWINQGPNRTLDRVARSEVCRPDWIPPLGVQVFDDADDKGTPKLIVVTLEWLNRYHKRYGNPAKTIKRLEDQLEAAKKEADRTTVKHQNELAEKDELIKKQREGIDNLFSDRDVLNRDIRSKAEQINNQVALISKQDRELARLRRYEQLAKDFAQSVNSTSEMIGEIPTAQKVMVEPLEMMPEAFVT